MKPKQLRSLKILDTLFPVIRPEPRDCPDAWGWMVIDPPSIAVQSDLTGDKEAHILLHEVFHAILQATSGLAIPNDPTQGEEHYVTLLSLGLIQVFKDNPNLIPFIQERLK